MFVQPYWEIPTALSHSHTPRSATLYFSNPKKTSSKPDTDERRTGPNYLSPTTKEGSQKRTSTPQTDAPPPPATSPNFSLPVGSLSRISGPSAALSRQGVRHLSFRLGPEKALLPHLRPRCWGLARSSDHLCLCPSRRDL